MEDISLFEPLDFDDVFIIKKLVTEKNSILLQKLTFKYNLEFKYSSDTCKTIFIDDNKVVIELVKNATEEDFTHELLHLRLHQLKFSYSFDECIKGYDKVKQILAKDHKIFDGIANNIAHVKMLPIFKKMGYDKDKFLSSDYPDISDEDIPIFGFKICDAKFESNFKNFLRAFINIKFTYSFKNAPQYDLLKIKLKNSNVKLFVILDHAFNTWEKDEANYDSKSWFMELFNKLDNWIADACIDS